MSEMVMREPERHLLPACHYCVYFSLSHTPSCFLLMLSGISPLLSVSFSCNWLFCQVLQELTLRTGSSAPRQVSSLAAQRLTALVGNGILSWQWCHPGLPLLQRPGTMGLAVLGRKKALSQVPSGDVVFPQ